MPTTASHALPCAPCTRSCKHAVSARAPLAGCLGSLLWTVGLFFSTGDCGMRHASQTRPCSHRRVVVPCASRSRRSLSMLGYAVPFKNVMLSVNASSC